jgi:hypothetical protein
MYMKEQRRSTSSDNSIPFLALLEANAKMILQVTVAKGVKIES